MFIDTMLVFKVHIELNSIIGKCVGEVDLAVLFMAHING
jgi:hypothetical protein